MIKTFVLTLLVVLFTTYVVATDETIEDMNYSFEQIHNITNTTYISCNFTQDQAYTDVFFNCSNITLQDCNLKNVNIPQGFIREGGINQHYNITIEYKTIEITNADGSITNETIETLIQTVID